MRLHEIDTINHLTKYLRLRHVIQRIQSIMWILLQNFSNIFALCLNKLVALKRLRYEAGVGCRFHSILVVGHSTRFGDLGERSSHMPVRDYTEVATSCIPITLTATLKFTLVWLLVVWVVVKFFRKICSNLVFRMLYTIWAGLFCWLDLILKIAAWKKSGYPALLASFTLITGPGRSCMHL